MTLKEEALQCHKFPRPGKIEVIPSKPCLSKRRLTAHGILSVIDKLFQDTEARRKAQAFRKIVPSMNGAENAAKIFAEKFGS